MSNAAGQADTLVEEFSAQLRPSLDDLANSLNPSGRVQAPDGVSARSFDTIMRIPVSVKIVLGSATMPVASLMKLGRGAVIPLDRRVGEPVDVTVNGRVVARGEVVVLEEGSSRFGISLTEVVGPTPADKSA
jgi:flagellar motor switch protein FliN/FliY